MAFLRLTIIALLFAACVEESTKPSSRSSLFSGTNSFGKTWQVSQIEIDFGTVTPHTCITDNFFTYYPNGSYEINEGASKCNPNDPPGIIGSWKLNDEETQLIIVLGDSVQVWDIEETKSDAHRISSSFSEGNRTYTLTSSN